MSVQFVPSVSPLVARDVSEAYGDRVVLDGVDLVANPGQPLGMVGENGVGKSTLMRLLAGVEPSDSGSIVTPSDLGYLVQEPALRDGATVGDVFVEALAPLHDSVARLEELAGSLKEGWAQDKYAAVLAWAELHDAWDADRRAELAAARLGLGRLERGRPAAAMSGGQRTRLALAALITRRPECVLLDEPTNHLDDEAVAFLEEFLTSLPEVVVVASHDRTFLDNVCKVVVDLDPTHLGVDGDGGNRFTGGYTDHLAAKRDSRRRWEQAFLDQQEELNELRRAAATTARQVAHNRPPRDGDKFIYHFKGQNVARTVSRRVRDAERRIEVLERERIPKPPKQLSFRGSLAPTSGTSKVAARSVGYLPQDVTFTRPDRTPQEVYAAATGSPVPLGDLGLLHPRELSRPVEVLSVGQQRRLALAILVARQPDLLLLDEPTNHISLTLADELEDALRGSTGTIVVAGHDRWLRDRWDGPVLAL